MKMFLISDNVDTLTGMRLAGVEGCIVHERAELRKALEDAIANKENGIILLTEKFGREFPDIIDDVRLNRRLPRYRPQTGLYHFLCKRSNRNKIIKKVRYFDYGRKA